jgi:hypothetical protein
MEARMSILSSQPAETAEERAERLEDQRKRWQTYAMDTLFAYAEHDSGLAERICVRLAEFVGPDDMLGPLVLKLVSAKRVGKPKKKATKWRPIDYWFLLEHYYGYRLGGATAAQAADKISAVMKIKNPDDVQRKRLPEARKVVPLEKLTPDVRAFVERQDSARHRKQSGG